MNVFWSDAQSLDPVPTAVAHPCEKTALEGALEAGQKRLITPILVGPSAKIEAVAKSSDLDLHEVQIVDTPHSQASAVESGGVGSRRLRGTVDERQFAYG